MTDDDGRSDPLEAQLHAWARAQIRDAPSVALSRVMRNQRTQSRRRPTRRAWAVAVGVAAAAGIATTSVVLSGSDAPSAQHRQALPGPSVTASSSPIASAPNTGATTQHSKSPQPGTVGPSPPPPPFGYCGGLRSVADARYLTVGGAAVAFVSAVVTGPGRPFPHVHVVRDVPVSDVHVLAGRLPDGPLTSIESSQVPSGRYLIVVGDTGGGGYFTSLGSYGVYAVAGTHAYRTCYDFTGKPAHRVTTGITTIHGLTRIFSRALRTPMS